MPSFKKPTQNQIETAIQRMRSPEFAAYFFSRLENPEWVIPLSERGLFANPPPPVVRGEDSVIFPHWPGSRYLARMAKHVPSEVASILASLETDNASVLGDIIDAALAMPTDVAVNLVPVITQSVRRWGLWLHTKDASELCVRLAEGGEGPSAIALAEALFAPKLEEGQDTLDRREEHWYKDGLKTVSPVLVRLEPREFLQTLCEWLKLTIDAKERVDPDSGADYSYLWRPAIEEHGQNPPWHLAGSLVEFVRQGFEDAIRDEAVSLHEALELLSSYSYLVFHRLRIHLINEFSNRDNELSRQTMMNRDLFDDYSYKHEYAMLVGRRLHLLTAEERDRWFGWVESGPDLSDFDDYIRDTQGREATEDDRRSRIEYWQFERFHWVRNHLDQGQRVFYEAMLAQEGEPELAVFSTRRLPVWVGHQSPMTIDDLAGLTFEEAVRRVSTWEPEEMSRLMGPDIEGLASTFGKYVGTSPEAFSREADALVSRPAIYVREFIAQMSEAIKNGRDIDVLAVLQLCRWVVERPLEERTTPEHGDTALVDKDWQWTRDQIAQFVQNICEAKTNDTPKYPLEELRESIWGTVSPLTGDRSTTYILDEGSEEDPRLRDYLTLGINSPRGKAVEAALEYARWVANHLRKEDEDVQALPGGFESIPEVREMLEWQIAHGNRSFEAFALIGSRIGLLYWLDKSWLAENARRIFHLQDVEESPSTAHGWAAWNAFLVWVRPHIEFYRLFKDEFDYAVRQSAQIRSVKESPIQPMDYLGEHLMILYGRGELGLDDDGELLRTFLTHSHPDIRRHAIGFVGRSIEAADTVPEEVLSRYMALWDVYWAGAGRQDAQENRDAWLFGIWFSSGKFPQPWALERLEEFVEATSAAEPDHAVVGELEKVARIDIVRAIRILNRIIRGDREGWRIHGWLSSATEILRTALKAGGDARKEAKQVIDYLGRRGHAGLGELLENARGS